MQGASGLHHIAAPSGLGAFIDAAYECPNCKRLSLVSEWDANYMGRSEVSGGTSTLDDQNWETPTWLPRYRDVREFKDVPEHIAQAATEATLCLSVGAYRAVGSLARAVIEATAKDKNAGGKDLAKRIDALRDADHIRIHTKEQAHEIRHFGNDMAHGDFIDPVAQEEAEEVIELMAEVLDEVYQSPARLEKRKAARLARTSEPGGA